MSTLAKGKAIIFSRCARIKTLARTVMSDFDRSVISLSVARAGKIFRSTRDAVAAEEAHARGAWYLRAFLSVLIQKT